MNAVKRKKISPEKQGRFHLRFWRWHFFAGLIVAPILMTSALTGGLYVMRPFIDEWTHGSLLRNAPQKNRPAPLSIQGQAALVQRGFPNGKIESILLPDSPERTTEFVLEQEGRQLRIFVDPYARRVVGERPRLDFMEWTIRIHKTLLLGKVGRTLVELAVSWAVVLVLTGLYLWWPRGRKGGVLWPRWSHRGRNFWKDLHAVVGALAVPVIILLIVTGISWTRFAGGNIDKVSDKIGRNTPGAYWFNLNIQKTPGNFPLGLDVLLEKSEGRALPLPYEIIFPKNENQALLIRGNHREDRSKMFALQLDPYTGKVIFENRWDDNNAVLAKPHLLGVSLHMGELFGLPNRLLMLSGCLAVFSLPISGFIMWWKRRPKGEWAAPKKEKKPIPIWLWIVLGVLAVVLPVFGISLVLAFAADWVWRTIRPAAK